MIFSTFTTIVITTTLMTKMAFCTYSPHKKIQAKKRRSCPWLAGEKSLVSQVEALDANYFVHFTKYHQPLFYFDSQFYLQLRIVSFCTREDLEEETHKSLACKVQLSSYLLSSIISFVFFKQKNVPLSMLRFDAILREGLEKLRISNCS